MIKNKVPSDNIDRIIYEWQQSGHLWFVEKRLKEKGMNDRIDATELAIEIAERSDFDWGIRRMTFAVREALERIWLKHPEWHMTQKGYFPKAGVKVEPNPADITDAFTAITKGDVRWARHYSIHHVEITAGFEYGDREVLAAVVFNNGELHRYTRELAKQIEKGLNGWQKAERGNSNVVLWYPSGY